MGRLLSKKKLDYIFANDLTTNVEVIALDQDGKEKKKFNISPGTELTRSLFTGQAFKLRDRDSNTLYGVMKSQNLKNIPDSVKIHIKMDGGKVITADENGMNYDVTYVKVADAETAVNDKRVQQFQSNF